MTAEKLLIGYYRLSMEDDSSEKDSNSITNQRMLVKDFIQRDYVLSEMQFRELYDDGYSGATLNRPGMQELLSLIRQERVACIVVKDFSRFSRDYIELGTYLEQILPFMGIRFISISDRYDSRNYNGKTLGLDSQFKGLLADFYVKDQSVKVKTALDAKRAQGHYCCGSAPFGYQRNPDNKSELLIVEQEAEVIRRVFNLTNQRYSKLEICQLFNEEGVPTPLQFMGKRQKVDKRKAASKNLQWTGDMVQKIINDKNYIGCMVYGKTKIPDPGSDREVPVPKSQWKIMENHHEPIVSREVFEKAQSLQIRHSSKSKFDQAATLLGGYIKCANCGRNLTGSKELHGHVLYSCAYSKGKEDTGCFAGKADSKILEILVLNEIKAHLKQVISQEQMDASMRQQHQNQIQAYQNEITDCEKRQKQLKQQHRQNYEKHHDGEWNQKQFQEAREQMELSGQQLQKRVQELKKMISEEEEILMKKNIPEEQMMKYLGYEKLTREMLDKYVEGVYVHDEGRIEVRWKENRFFAENLLKNHSTGGMMKT